MTEEKGKVNVLFLSFKERWLSPVNFDVPQLSH
jgi:hypothetical protein